MWAAILCMLTWGGKPCLAICETLLGVNILDQFPDSPSHTLVLPCGGGGAVCPPPPPPPHPSLYILALSLLPLLRLGMSPGWVCKLSHFRELFTHSRAAQSKYGRRFCMVHSQASQCFTWAYWALLVHEHLLELWAWSRTPLQLPKAGEVPSWGASPLCLPVEQ